MKATHSVCFYIGPFRLPVLSRFVLVLFLICSGYHGHSQVSITTDGSAPDASAMLEINSTSKGLLIPRMTEAQRSSIGSPAAGLMVFQNNNTAGHYLYTGSAWKRIGTVTTPSLNDGSILFSQGNDISANTGQLFWNNSTLRMGIGTNVPGQKLSVNGTIESTSGGFKFPDLSVQTKAAKGCLITFGGDSNGSGYYLRPFGEVNEADISGSGIRTVFPVPVAGRIVAISWRSESATSSSIYRIYHGTGSTFTDITLTGLNGTLYGLNMNLNAGDYVEVKHSSGSLANKIIFILYLNE
jgi:hypothetical protein